MKTEMPNQAPEPTPLRATPAASSYAGLRREKSASAVLWRDESAYARLRRDKFAPIAPRSVAARR